MAKYTVEEIEGTGRRARFMALGFERDGWIMPDGFGVVLREYGQLVFSPEVISGVRHDADDALRPGEARPGGNWNADP